MFGLLVGSVKKKFLGSDKQPLLVECCITKQFDPFVLLQYENGQFHRGGSLDAILKDITGVDSPDFLKYNLDECLRPLALSDEDLDILRKQHHITKLGKVYEIDFSSKEKDVVNYLVENVKISDETWRKVLGKHIFIVMRTIYADQITIERKSWFTSSVANYGSSEKPMVIAYSCLRFDVKKDGTLSNPKWEH